MAKKKEPMRNMLIVLPGITGSVLAKDGKEIWGDSLQAVWQGLTSRGQSLQNMALTAPDDPNLDDLGDGITATRLIDGVTIIPGFKKIDGYKGLRNFLHQHFDLIDGSLTEKKPANYFEFPYDWRRDNRFTALKLKALIDHQLPEWRDHSGFKQAKVILLAHSMGGLVSRYYLECMGGWQNCKGLITFGTPYQGSVSQLNYLVNGYKDMGLDLTKVLRSFTSCYQLLPTYEVVKRDGQYRAPIDLPLPNLDPERMKQAWNDFHYKIQESVETKKHSRNIRPVVGGKQTTLQSATFDGQKLTVHSDIRPTEVDQALFDGDGTVPRYSAIPRELHTTLASDFVVAKHGSMQNATPIHLQLLEQLKQLQAIAPKRMAKRGFGRVDETQPALNLELDDLFLPDEPVTIQAKLVGGENNHTGPLQAEIEYVDSQQPKRQLQLQPTDNGYAVEYQLDAGLYRVRVHHPIINESVTDLFAVVNS